MFSWAKKEFQIFLKNIVTFQKKVSERNVGFFSFMLLICKIESDFVPGRSETEEFVPRFLFVPIPGTKGLRDTKNSLSQDKGTIQFLLYQLYLTSRLMYNDFCCTMQQLGHSLEIHDATGRGLLQEGRGKLDSRNLSILGWHLFRITFFSTKLNTYL